MVNQEGRRKCRRNKGNGKDRKNKKIKTLKNGEKRRRGRWHELSEWMNEIVGGITEENRLDEGRRKVKWCDTDGINSTTNKCLGSGSLEALKSLQLGQVCNYRV